MGAIMSIKISNCKIFKFSKDNPYVAKIQSGDMVEIETLDCFSNQLKTKEDTLDAIDWNQINPATGPIYIEGAMPGDTLKVTIEDIVLCDQGVMAAEEGGGPLGHLLKGTKTKIIPIIDGKAIFDSKLSIPLKPMIGVIGVAPGEEDINTGTPGNHGGNMDNLMITKGSTLYLPIFVEGALFALGDLHAVMGDGEIGVTGVEIPGSVKAKLEVMKGLTLNNPVLENAEKFTTIASEKNLEDAVNRATVDMAMILKERIDMDLHDIAMLMSAVGNTEICQVVDPLRTARFVMPKWVLKGYGFEF
jgi:amidase